jgi:hypothetical protein
MFMGFRCVGREAATARGWSEPGVMLLTGVAPGV